MRPYRKAIFFSLVMVYEIMVGSGMIIISVIVSLVIIVSSSAVGGVLSVVDPFGFFAPPKPLVTEKDPVKKKSAEGNKKYLYNGESGVEIKIPEGMSHDTDENCVYFYDIPLWVKYGKHWLRSEYINWNKSEAPNVVGKGHWCLQDNEDVNFAYKENAIQTENLKGGSIPKNRANFARIGKNVRLLLWEKDTDTYPAIGYKNKKRDIIEGSEYGTDKVFDFRTTSIGSNNVDAFQIVKKGESFKNI